MSTILTVIDAHKGPVKIDTAAGGVLFCDVDGTVADLTHRRIASDAAPKAYKWPVFRKNMDKDLPIQPIIDAVKTLKNAGWIVVMMTARSRIDLEVTEEWLAAHDIVYDAIYIRDDWMRNEDGSIKLSRKGKQMPDSRKDDIVKTELLAQARADGYDPTLVFDDRDQVVVMWRANGIMCVQTAEGDF